jgi:hypothetical protein
MLDPFSATKYKIVIPSEVRNPGTEFDEPRSMRNTQ